MHVSGSIVQQNEMLLESMEAAVQNGGPVRFPSTAMTVCMLTSLPIQIPPHVVSQFKQQCRSATGLWDPLLPLRVVHS